MRTTLYILIVWLLACGHAMAAGSMFDLYQQNRQQGIGNYITEDFVLQAHSMLFNELVGDIEETILVPAVQDITRQLLAQLRTDKDPDALTTGNVRYLLVLDALLQGTPPDQIDDLEVASELTAITLAAGTGRSQLAGQTIDYSRFRVRGRYSRSPELGNWFRAMTWGGSVLFPLVDSGATGITAAIADQMTGQALQLTALLQQEPVRDQYRQVDRLLSLLFGASNELGPDAYVAVQAQHRGAAVADLRRILFERAERDGRIPLIIDAVVRVDLLEDGRTAGEVLTGFHLLPRRSLPDSAVLQAMVYPSVGGWQGGEQQHPFTLSMAGGKPVKGFPRGLELMAALGSTDAAAQLREDGDSNYAGYEEAMAKARSLAHRPSGLAINSGLIGYWLNQGQKLQPDNRRRLNSMLSYWTWGRYISLLYAKQSVTGMDKSMILLKERTTAWLEPVPELYLRLQKDMQSLKNGLTTLNPASSDIGQKINEYIDLLGQLVAIASLEPVGQPLKPESISLLNGLDIRFFSLIGVKDHPIVVDVHTEPNSGKVLAEGIGFAVAVQHKLDDQQVRGALFSHYEFKADKRLTDAEWQEMLLSRDSSLQ